MREGEGEKAGDNRELERKVREGREKERKRERDR